jgi:hypothetical protein
MRRSIFLSGFMRYYNPWISGIKPKRFLEERVQLLKESKMISDKRCFNPDWNKRAA